MKCHLFFAFCLLNVYAEGKWRPEYNHERHENDCLERHSDNSKERHDGHRERHYEPRENSEYSKERHSANSKERYDGHRGRHEPREKLEYSKERHSDNSKERHDGHRERHYEHREKHHGNNWHRRETANEISTFEPQRFLPDPPDHTKLIPMARYVLHNADWASIATISVLPAIEGFPFSNVKSVADGPRSNSTGVPFFYMSPLDFTAKDLAKNTRATVLVSLEETRYCEKKNLDPEDPRCTRLMLSGKMKKMRPDTPEYTFAKAALFERHPAMADFPPDHDWFVAKLKIAQIAMVDWFGGAKFIPVREYLAYNYTETKTTVTSTNTPSSSHTTTINGPETTVTQII